jgi:transcriptional regulator with XRE-family HTH domain
VRQRALPEDEELKRLRAEGLSYAAIGERYGVTREAVSQAFARRKLAPPQRKKYALYIPWTVREAHQFDVQNRILRLYARRDMGEELPPMEAKRLDNFLREMAKRDLVITYDREDGWGYTRRLPEDGARIFRHPDVAVAEPAAH